MAVFDRRVQAAWAHILLALALLGQAWANTETVLIDFHGIAVDQDGNPPLALLAPTPGQFYFNGTDSLAQTYTLPVIPQAKYLARVCWPASMPADISIAFNEEKHEVTVYASQESLVPLRSEKGPRTVPYEVHLSPLEYGLIPEDVLPMISSVALSVALSAIAAYFVAKRL